MPDSTPGHPQSYTITAAEYRAFDTAVLALSDQDAKDRNDAVEQYHAETGMTPGSHTRRYVPEDIECCLYAIRTLSDQGHPIAAYILLYGRAPYIIDMPEHWI